MYYTRGVLYTREMDGYFLMPLALSLLILFEISFGVNTNRSAIPVTLVKAYHRLGPKSCLKISLDMGIFFDLEKCLGLMYPLYPNLGKISSVRNTLTNPRKYDILRNPNLGKNIWCS
jgi:hypothetical protein